LILTKYVIFNFKGEYCVTRFFPWQMTYKKKLVSSCLIIIQHDIFDMKLTTFGEFVIYYLIIRHE